MELRKCQKCNNDLSFSVEFDETSCTFCGEVNVFKNHRIKSVKQDSSITLSNSGDSTTIIAAVATIIS